MISFRLEKVCCKCRKKNKVFKIFVCKKNRFTFVGEYSLTFLEMHADLTDRQKEIIDVSLELIDENGIQGLTIKNLARKIGFTEAAIYRHYENKTQILVAILDFFKGNSERFFATELAENKSVMTKIERLFVSHFRSFTERPSLVAVIFSEEIFRNEEILVEKVRNLMESNTKSLASILEKGQQSGEIRSDIATESLATIVLGTLRMFVKQWHTSANEFDLTQKGAELIHSIHLLLKNNN